MRTRFEPAAMEIVCRYAAGYFPLYDAAGDFYWERLPFRAVIPLNAETAARAARMGRRSRGKFVIRHTSTVPRVIAMLRDEKVKLHTWVRKEVVAIYRTLWSVGLLQTVEAFDAGTGKLAGALVGIVLPGTFVAETMFSLAADASKACLCRLVEEAHAAGHRMIDVQTPHDGGEAAGMVEMGELLSEPVEWGDAACVWGSRRTPHPCVRLGEETVTLTTFLRAVRAGWRTRFAGSVTEWLALSSALAQALRRHGEARAMLQRIDRQQLRSAWPMLRSNFRPEAEKAVAAYLAAGVP